MDVEGTAERDRQQSRTLRDDRREYKRVSWWWDARSDCNRGRYAWRSNGRE